MSEAHPFKATVFGCRGSGDNFPMMDEIILFQQEIEKNRMLDFIHRLVPQLKGGQKLEDVLGGPIDNENLCATLKQYIQTTPQLLPRVYGGSTTSVLVETPDGKDILLDVGSGAIMAGLYLGKKWSMDAKKDRELYVLGSHSHHDHTSGVDQNTMWFNPRLTAHFYGNKSFLRSVDLDLNLFGMGDHSETDGLRTPLNKKMLPAKFEAHEIGPGKEFSIGDTKITTLEAHHPAPCIMYIIQNGRNKFVFATDHEYFPKNIPEGANLPKALLDQYPTFVAESHPLEAKLWEASRGADLLYRDAPYDEKHYFAIGGGVPTCRWGHSLREQAIKQMEECGIKRLLIGHHGRLDKWQDMKVVDEELREKYNPKTSWHQVSLAKTGDYHIFGTPHQTIIQRS